MNLPFRMVSNFSPTGDQPRAIDELTSALRSGARRLTLEGVTGSGKTFTMANIIDKWARPALIVSHNKTLAAQLYTELKAFFPNNAVEYFVSYYDYYQPEAYIPRTDTYIEKDASINEEIERFRLAATNALLGRRDVVVIASVSCIYGLGSPVDYAEMVVDVRVGQEIERDALLRKLVEIQYRRNDVEPLPGTFRVRGDTVDCFPSYCRTGVRIAFFGDEVDALETLDPLTGKLIERLDRTVISPAKHFVMPREKILPALDGIRREMAERVRWFLENDKLLEAQRLQQRTLFDLDMLKEIGYCAGIENYARHLGGRPAGAPPDCLIDYFPAEFLTIIDESHVTVPQLRGMYNGDQARKQVLVDYGFRLPSAKDNRPLCFEEFLEKVGPILFASATPGPYELSVSEQVSRQLIRPTGLLDPPVEVRPLSGQIDDLIEEVRRTAEANDRVLVTTLTKRTAEDLTQYLADAGLRVEYLHADIDAIERVEILSRLRRGEFDCLIGINLLREGLDLPEVALVAVLDADKEGFLRSDTALMQTAGRTARHALGRVILYADHVTESMRRMMETTSARRQYQQEYNKKHGIVPRGVERLQHDRLRVRQESEAIERRVVAESGAEYNVFEALRTVEREMREAAEALEYERAALLRDELAELRAAMGQEDNADKSKKPGHGRKRRSPKRNPRSQSIR